MFYLYKITCLTNQKLYIGQTIQPNKRWYEHRRQAANPTQVIHHAIKKHGNDNFTFEVIAICKTQDDANELETILVKQYESHISTGKGYNVSLGGMNAPKTEAWKQLMRQYQSNAAYRENQRVKMIAHWQTHIPPGTGVIPTEATRLLLSQAMKEWHQNNQAPCFGKKLSEEHIEAIRTANRNRTYSAMSEETKAKLRLANTGKKASDEAKKKMSQAQQHNKSAHRFKVGQKSWNKYPFTNEQIQEMVEMNKIMGIRRIATHFGVSFSVIQTRLAKARL